MAPLPTELRRQLERAVLQAREVSERASETALKVLAVNADQPFATLSDDQKAHRRALRARMTQLADTDTAYDAGDRDPRGFRSLVEEVAYEQWHRMLFARFLAENGLLLHPDHGVGVSLEECAALAPGLGEPDEWMVAARFAAEMLPGIFRRDDPSARVRFAANDRGDLERILNALSEALFQADDALGWVYQFWQTKAKDEVNRSGRKVGGKDLYPVTQLFTEHYMVRFLLENSLGAWWAARHPKSPLLEEWEYLRFGEDGTPVAGSFPGWPERTAEVTVMDPCCGSGHFLVAAADMLRKMRIEEEGIATSQAAEAVLRDNLFGLELDPRCTQLAAFALAFDSWKAGLNPKADILPNIACSGVAVSGQLSEWQRLAGSDVNLQHTLEQLHSLFLRAPQVGSLINPTALSPREQLFTSNYESVAPVLEEALAASGSDPVASVFGSSARGIERAGWLLARKYTLVATNVPYLGHNDQEQVLADYIGAYYPDGRADLAAAFVIRCRELTAEGGCYAMITPQNWLYLVSYKRLRQTLLREQSWSIVARIGEGGFASSAAAGAFPFLGIWENDIPEPSQLITGIDASPGGTPDEKSVILRTKEPITVLQGSQRSNPDGIVSLAVSEDAQLLRAYATCYQGISSGDSARAVLKFWELPGINAGWKLYQTPPQETAMFNGREHIVNWSIIENGVTSPAIRGREAWEKRGVAIGQMRQLPATFYDGSLFSNSTPVVIPHEEEYLLPVLAFCMSPDFPSALRIINPKLSVDNGYVGKVPFDIEHWRAEALKRWPTGLPEPVADDPTQWLFKGIIIGSRSPLQVAVAKLLGYRWPKQVQDALDDMADSEGVVCAPGLAGEPEGGERLRRYLASVYQGAWQPGTVDQLLAEVGFSGKSLEQWLRDGFFQQHCGVFQMPFIWQVWDGRRDGFSALVNYHTLNHAKLQKLTYTYLGSWIDRQKDLLSQGTAGADDRLAAALTLQRKLAQILEGEKPLDIYVRWKKKHEQPIGWNPDFNDGVRLNIRPFMEAGVLRWKPNIKWGKDRGKNPDGSDRINDIHLSLAEKREARKAAGIT